MADHSGCFRTDIDGQSKSRSIQPPIQPAASNDSSCNLSVSWIDIQTTTSEKPDDNIDSHVSFESNEGFIPGGIPIVVDDRHFGDSRKPLVGMETNFNTKDVSADVTGEDCHDEQQEQHFQQQPAHQENTNDKPKPLGISDENVPYVEIVDTHYEKVEGYDWDGILDLRNRMKKQQEQQQQQQQKGFTALQWVTEFRLYLTDGLIEEATNEASLALDDGPRYEVVDDKNTENAANYRRGKLPHGADNEGSFKNDGVDDFVEFVETSKQVVGTDAKASAKHSLEDVKAENDEEYASLALSPLDVLTNSLMGTKAFHRNHHHHAVRLTELIVGGPSLKLGESSIERLARALACGGSVGLRKVVLIVSAVDLPAMKALGDAFRATYNSLEDFHFFASQTTERLVASRSRYKSVPTPCVLGPGISYWVDTWTSNPQNSLRSLNLSRMDIGDEAAFALSRLLLAAPSLKILNLAQDDFYGSSKIIHPKEMDRLGDSQSPLSFAGTKRLLESLILIEDIKSRSLASPNHSPLSCANLIELDLSGWVLEDEKTEQNRDWFEDDDKVIDNFYDDYNYIDDGSGEDGFEFAVDEGDSNRKNGDLETKHALRRTQRACCIIASMLRVNTTLEKLVLTAEDSNTDTNLSELSENSCKNRGSLSVRSTLAIARALRDHVSNPTKGSSSSNSNRKSNCGRRPLGSNLRTLILSTNYTRGATPSKSHDASSWAITERKRAVAKVFYQALVGRPIYQLRLEELSCTMAFKGLEPLGGNVSSSINATKNDFGSKSSSSSDLRHQLDFFLEKNRSINQSLKKLDTVWLPRLSSLVVAPNPPTTDEEDEDCHFVEIEFIDSESTTTSGAGFAINSTRKSQKNSIPILVLVLPNLLAKLGEEPSSQNVLFSCSRILATKTNVWEMSNENRYKAASRHQLNS